MDEKLHSELMAVVEQIRDYESPDGYGIDFIEENPDILLENYIQKRIQESK